MSCNRCKSKNNLCKCKPRNCGCPVRISDSCVTVTVDLECSNIERGKTLDQVLLDIDQYLCELLEIIQNAGSIQIANVGAGIKLYKGINATGTREFRTILSDSLKITEGTETISIEQITTNVGTGAKVFKGAGLNKEQQLRSITSTSLNVTENDNTINIEAPIFNESTYTVDNITGAGAGTYKDSTTTGSNTQFNFRKIKSDSLIITEGTDSISIETNADTGTVRDFIVDTRYTGADEQGSYAKPFKNLDNAIVAYIGSGDIVRPEYNTSRILCIGGETHNFSTPLSINNLRLQIEEGTNIKYVGTPLYSIDFSTIQAAMGGYGSQTDNINITVTGKGRLVSEKLMVKVVNSGHNRVTYPQSEWFNNRLTMEDIDLMSLYKQSEFIVGITRDDGSPWVSEDREALFFTGPINEPAFYAMGGTGTAPEYDNSFNVSVFLKNIKISSLTQIPLKVKDTSVFIENIEISLEKYAGYVIVDPASLSGGKIIEDPIGSYNLPSYRQGLTLIEVEGNSKVVCEGKVDSTGFAITKGEANYNLKGSDILLKIIDSLESQTNGGTQFEHYIKTGAFTPNVELQSVTTFINIGTNGDFINTSVNPFTTANIKNCSFPFTKNVEVDLTRNNIISTENYFKGQYITSLRKFGTRLLASATLPVGGEFINTKSNDSDTANWFLDIVI